MCRPPFVSFAFTFISLLGFVIFNNSFVSRKIVFGVQRYLLRIRTTLLCSRIVLVLVGIARVASYCYRVRVGSSCIAVYLLVS
jgi:hypothetical protein